VSLSKNAPAVVSIGEEFTYELIVTTQSEVSDVTVSDTVPEGAAYIRSDPEAVREGNKLSWKFQNVNPGESKTIRVTVKADAEGQLTHCATASAVPQVCITTLVGRPQLAITKTGPATAQLGQDVTYTVVVQNTGKTVAKNVVVTDTVPDGLSSPDDKRELSFPIGDLEPGGSKSIPVVLKTTKRGKSINAVVAVANNAEKVAAEAPTTVVQAAVKIVKTTKDHDLFVNRAAAYNVEVSNTGDTRLTGVVVTDTAAPETVIATAEGATVDGKTATWNVGELQPGEKKMFIVKVLSKTPGKFTDTASVMTAEGPRDSAQDSTTWRGVSGVLLEMADETDPIQVGETTKYTIRVTNQGTTTALSQVKISAQIAPELELVPGTLSDEGVADGRVITWPILPTVDPKVTVTRTYIVKGVKAGDARSSVSITTMTRPEPIVQNESTTVY